MIRRRLIIEWDDEGTDTDEQVLADYLEDKWSIDDLISLDQENDPQYHVNVKFWVEDAPK